MEAWSLDRNHDRTEGERLLKARNYAEAETFWNGRRWMQRSAGTRLPSAFKCGCYWRRRSANNCIWTRRSALVRAAIDVAARTDDRVAYLQCLDALADIFGDQGNFAAVEKVTRDALKIESTLPHPDPLRMARRVHRLGMARHHTGRADEAIPMLEKAVALHEENFGSEHVETGNQLMALGVVHRAHGNHEEAQKCLRRALKIHETACGRQSAEAIQDLHHLAGSLEESGDLAGAAAQYERALLFKHRAIGGDMDDEAELQFGMANLYVNWQNYSRARELLLECVATFRRKGGVRLAVGYETLAYVEECSGRYPEAAARIAIGGEGVGDAGSGAAAGTAALPGASRRSAGIAAPEGRR